MLFSFLSPLSSILFTFPLHLSFLLYALILLNISPVPMELLAVTRVTFLKLFTVTQNFPLHGPLSAIPGWITGLIYEAMVYNMAFDIKQFPLNSVSECLSAYLLSFFFSCYLQVTA